MSHPILVTGAAGGAQGSTGRIIATTLLRHGSVLLGREVRRRPDEGIVRD